MKNREIKFEIKLKAKEAINGYKIGETVIIVNPIFDKKVGIAFYQIDKNFEIVYKRQYTGLKDKNRKEIFENDIIRINNTDYIVKYYGASFTLFTKKDDVYATILTIDNSKRFEVIGNLFENKELIKP